MINYEALFKVSYGLYIVCAGDRKEGNGFISNTFFQVTAEPPRFASCCNKNNFTASLIQKHGAFTVSILSKDTPADVIATFGYKTGRYIDKLKDMTLDYSQNGIPVVLNSAIAFLECRVVQTIDIDTHLMFIGELVQAELLDGASEALTYDYYRKTKKGFAPKNAPTYIDQSKLQQKKPEETSKKFKCPACGYIYDEALEKDRFQDLPDDWVCPACGCEKSDFIEL